VKHRIKANYHALLSGEAELQNQLATLSQMSKTYKEEIRNNRSSLAKKIKRLKSELKIRNQKAMLAELEALKITNIKKLESLYTKVAKQAESDCVDLAISIAKKIVGELVSEGKSNLKNRILAVLPRVALSRQVKIIVNPAEISELYDLFGSRSSQTNIMLESCSEITLGNARIESISGTIEISWQSQLEAIVDLVNSNHHESNEGNLCVI
jgi:flagellar biosynthesis/type III secretory pathway protein FliH